MLHGPVLAFESERELESQQSLRFLERERDGKNLFMTIVP